MMASVLSFRATSLSSRTVSMSLQAWFSSFWASALSLTSWQYFSSSSFFSQIARSLSTSAEASSFIKNKCKKTTKTVGDKKQSKFLYLFKFLPWEFWNILIWFAHCCTFPFMPTCFLHRCDSGIPSLGRNTFLSQHKDMLPDKLPIRWRTKEFCSS